MRRHQEALLIGAAACCLAGLVLLPLALVVLYGGTPPIDLTASHPELRAVAWIWPPVALLATSALVAGGTALGALAIGVPLGLALGRYDVPGRGWALLVHGFPMFLPPFLLALGWFHILGRGGLVGSESTARVLFGPWGVIGALTLALAPIVTWLVTLGAAGVDPALEDAARLVATPGRIATHILLPLAAPAISVAALIVFTLAFSELAVPMFLRVRTYPGAVFARLGGIDAAPAEAAALALPLVGVALGLLVLERWAARRWSAPVLAWRAARRPLPLGRWRGVLGALAWCAVALSVLPLAALGARGIPSLPRLAGWVGSSLRNSLAAAGIGATLISALGLIAGWAVGRRRPGAGVLDALAFLGLATPAAVLGVGLIAVWNRPATQIVYGSLAIVVLGYVARYAVIGVRAVAVGVGQSSASTEEAAATAGARFSRRLLHIVLPEQRRAVTVAWVLGFVFCLRDLDTVVLFYPPGGEPLTVRIFTLEANAPESLVAALAVLHVGVTAAALVLGAAIVRLLGGRR